jgi:preprotein translocase subunit YajC
MQILNNILDIFIPSAHADPIMTPAAQNGGMSMIMMLGVFVFFMYFVLWRPQNKRAKEHRDLITALTMGDEVVTSGGIIGKITKLTDNYVVLGLSENNEITVQKSAIVSALPKGTLKSI